MHQQLQALPKKGKTMVKFSGISPAGKMPRHIRVIAMKS